MERGTDEADDNGKRVDAQSDAGGSRRLGNPTRLIPRQTPSDEPKSVTPRPAVFEDDAAPARRASPFGPGGVGSMFAPRGFGNGRIQVWGCSPGCLIASLIVSVVLTLFLNAIF